MIDFIGNEGDAEPRADLADVAQGRCAHHRAGRVGRAHQQHAIERASRMFGLDHGGGDDMAVARAGGERRRLDPDRFENVAIGRIAGRRDRDPRAGVEKREERENESTRRPGGDGDPLWRHRQAVGLVIVAGDARAQRRQPERLRVADPAGVERTDRGVPHDARRWRRRLARFHPDDPPPLRLEARRRLENLHSQERRDAAAQRSAVRARPCRSRLLSPFCRHNDCLSRPKPFRRPPQPRGTDVRSPAIRRPGRQHRVFRFATTGKTHPVLEGGYFRRPARCRLRRETV